MELDWWHPKQLRKQAATTAQLTKDTLRARANEDFASYRLVNLADALTDESQIRSHNRLSVTGLRAQWQLLTALVRRGAGGPPEVIIDLGCGVGTQTEALRLEFPAARVIGIEVSDDAVAFARRHFPECTFVAGVVDPYDPASCALRATLATRDVQDARVLIVCSEFYPFTRTGSSETHHAWIRHLRESATATTVVIKAAGWYLYDAESATRSIVGSPDAFRHFPEAFRVYIPSARISGALGPFGRLAERIARRAARLMLPLRRGSLVEVVDVVPPVRRTR